MDINIQRDFTRSDTARFGNKADTHRAFDKTDDFEPVRSCTVCRDGKLVAYFQITRKIPSRNRLNDTFVVVFGHSSLFDERGL